METDYQITCYIYIDDRNAFMDQSGKLLGAAV